jgi:hypothetical protein
VLAFGLLCVGAFAADGEADGASPATVRGADDALAVGDGPALDRAGFPGFAAEPNTRTSNASSKPMNGTGTLFFMAGWLDAVTNGDPEFAVHIPQC